jgi:hypothetical protein
MAGEPPRSRTSGSPALFVVSTGARREQCPQNGAWASDVCGVRHSPAGVGHDAAALAELEEEVGWELEGHLGKPSSLSELPPIALADIGVPLGVDRRSLLPTSGKQASRNAERAR